MSASLLLVILMLVMLVMGIPIGAAIGMAAIATILITGKAALMTAAITSIQGMNSFLLLAFPLFVLVGKVMERGGSANRLFRFANGFVGWMTGGMGAVTVTSSMIFGGISGSSVADAAGLAPIQIKGMREYDYPEDYAAGLAVASSTLAVVIPPSILLVLYAVAANTSVAALLLGGVLPGLFITLALGVANYVYSVKNHWNPGRAFSWKALTSNAREGLLSAITPVIILGSMFFGWVTATEAAAIAVLWVILLSMAILREMSWKDLIVTIRETAVESAAILFLLASASVVSNIMTLDQVPQSLAAWVANSGMPIWGVWGAITVVLLLAGMFFDPTSSIVVLVPLLLPILRVLNIDLVHFGVFMTVALAMGLLTPPVAPCLMAVSVASKIPLEKVFKRTLPFIIILVGVLLVLAAVPQITTWLPTHAIAKP